MESVTNITFSTSHSRYLTHSLCKEISFNKHETVGSSILVKAISSNKYQTVESELFITNSLLVPPKIYQTSADNLSSVPWHSQLDSIYKK